MLSRIEIKTNGITSRVFIDGKELHGIESCRFEHYSESLPSLEIKFVGADVSISGQSALELPE
jgi:hypothetical protein